jgi:hypothetical protein
MMSKTPSTTKIMIIRHAEKLPTSDHDDRVSAGTKVLEGPTYGVDVDGNNSNESLIVQGWQRAVALVPFFDPTNGASRAAGVSKPQFLFASDSKSQRPVETITPLGSKLGLTAAVEKKGDYKKIADDAKACGGIALICWQHQDIPEMANHILSNKTTVPQKWPGDRFDVVWVFDLDPKTGTYSFSQVPQRLLAGDSPDPIAAG